MKPIPNFTAIITLDIFTKVYTKAVVKNRFKPINYNWFGFYVRKHLLNKLQQTIV